jgi:hypothetical protein
MNYRDGFWLILDENVADLWLILDGFGVILVEIVAMGLLSVMVENYSVDCADLRLLSNSLRSKHDKRLDFPTIESPITTIFNKYSFSSPFLLLNAPLISLMNFYFL